MPTSLPRPFSACAGKAKSICDVLLEEPNQVELEDAKDPITARDCYAVLYRVGGLDKYLLAA